ncbi:transposase [Massilia sp. JS1662]|nr:transposase [Massilia sp. JS1662]
MLIAHRITLAPNNVQATYLARAAGVARFAYNWALSEWQRQYVAHQADPALPAPSQFSLRRQLNAIKREQFPWMLDVTKNAPQMAIIQLGDAFKNFFAHRARYPRFRRKGVDDRFTLSNDQFRVDGKRFHIPKLGWVRMREALRFTGRIVSATISRRADRWHVSIAVDATEASLPPADNQGVVGIDLGVSALATLSTGEQWPGPKALRSLLDRLRQLSRSLSRKVKGSRNWDRAKRRLVRLHARIANMRRDSLHKLTTSVTRRFHTIGIENLNVRGMLSNRHLSRAIADMGFHELRRQLEYKAAWRCGHVVVVDRWYPSSKTCSCCGHWLKELALGTRSWTCPECAVWHDRDVNAAVNLKNMAMSSIATACGGNGSGPVREQETKPVPVKQELSSKVNYS